MDNNFAMGVMHMVFVHKGSILLVSPCHALASLLGIQLGDSVVEDGLNLALGRVHAFSFVSHSAYIQQLSCPYIFLVSSIQVWLTSEGTPIAGQTFSLTCRYRGTGSRVVSSYQWMKDNSILQNKTTETLSFMRLRLSDAGRYTCRLFDHYGIMDITLTGMLEIRSHQTN